MQVPIKFMLDYARDNNFGVSRFLVSNLESIEAVDGAAENMDSPIIFDIYLPLMRKSCLICVEEIAKKFIKTSNFPAALYADHIESVDECISVIDRGYDGVMIDLSKLSLIENIKGSREVVNYAHKKGVFVEGEVGTITRSSIGKGTETDPEEAREYVNKSGIDCLAVSIGVHSGFYDNEPDLNYDLIKELSKTGVHLCLHGASGLSMGAVRKCIESGMNYTGYGTDPFYKYFSKIDEIRKKEGEKFIDTSRIIVPARDEMQKEIKTKITIVSIGPGRTETIEIK